MAGMEGAMRAMAAEQLQSMPMTNPEAGAGAMAPVEEASEMGGSVEDVEAALQTVESYFANKSSDVGDAARKAVLALREMLTKSAEEGEPEGGMGEADSPEAVGKEPFDQMS